MKKRIRGIARWALKFTFIVAKIVPDTMLYALVDLVVATIFYRKNSRLLRNTRRSIETVFGDRKSPQEKEALARKVFKQLARVIAEGVSYITRPSGFKNKVLIEGEPHLKNALAKGKGVVAVTAHLGNFPLMLGWLADMGYPVNVIVRRPRDARMGELIVNKFGLFNGRVIFTVPERACIQKCIKALRQNEIVVILIDQNYGADARIFVDFLGKKAATGASPVAFARRTGASVVPVFCTRDQQDNLRIIIEPEVALGHDHLDAAYLQKELQKLTDIIARYVMAYPELWSWMHDRWKSKVSAADKTI